MQRPKTVVITTNTTTQAFPLDYWTNGYGLSVTYSKSTMTAVYTIQYSMLNPYKDDVTGLPYTTSYKVSGNWQNSDDPLVVNASTSRSSNFAYPPRACRLVTSNVSGGSLTFVMIAKGDDS